MQYGIDTSKDREGNKFYEFYVRDHIGIFAQKHFYNENDGHEWLKKYYPAAERE